MYAPSHEPVKNPKNPSNFRRFKGFSSAYANPFTPFHFFLKSVVSKKKNSGEILAVLRVSKKKNCGKYYDRTGKRTNFKENEKS